MDTWIYLSQGFAVAMTPENLVIAPDRLFRRDHRRPAAGPWPYQRRGDFTAAGLCAAPACGIGADPAGDGLYRLRIRGAYFLDSA